MKSPDCVLSSLGFNSRVTQGGVLREVTTYTGGCTPGCVKEIVASLCMVAFADRLGDDEGTGPKELSFKVGSLACRINRWRESTLLEIGSTLGGISSVVEGGRLLVAHSERRRWRWWREMMRMRRREDLGGRTGEVVYTWCRHTGVHFTVRACEERMAGSTTATSHATIVFCT